MGVPPLLTVTEPRAHSGWDLGEVGGHGDSETLPALPAAPRRVPLSFQSLWKVRGDSLLYLGLYTIIVIIVIYRARAG